MINTASKRLEKYSSKADGTIIGKRYSDTKELSVNKFAGAIKRQVEIEQKVKSICDDVDIIYLPYYIIFAKELNKQTNWTNRNNFYNKWAQRGLNWFKLMQIEAAIFNQAPELRTINNLPERIRHFPFFETELPYIKDVSGNSADGVNQGADIAVGKVGNCLSFNGTYAIVNFTSTPAYDDFTITAWIKTKRTTAQNLMGGTAHRASIKLNNGVVMLKKVGEADAIGSTILYDLNKWNFIAIIYKKGVSITYFINGQAETVADTLNISSVGISRIGNNANCTFPMCQTDFFCGLTDEIIIWDRALSIDELNIYFNSTKLGGNDLKETEAPNCGLPT